MNATAEIRINTTVPEDILSALSRTRGKFSDLVHVFHCIQIGTDKWVGVAGDGDNAAYEYFVMDRGRFTCTDCGYGCTDFALRDVLNKEIST